MLRVAEEDASLLLGFWHQLVLDVKYGIAPVYEYSTSTRTVLYRNEIGRATSTSTVLIAWRGGARCS